MYFLVIFGVFEWLYLVVEGLNVINDPRCNKVLNVITFCPKCNNNLPYLKLPNNSNYSNKCRPQISAAFGGGGLISAAALIHVNTVPSGITMVLSTALK